MKIVILRSVSGSVQDCVDENYLQEFDTKYAERVIRHLRGGFDACSACVQDCVGCLSKYNRSHGEDELSVRDFPAVLPYVLEEPADYLPSDLPEHDILLAIHIHEQVLLEVLKVCSEWGTKGVIVPLEAPDWISGSARVEAEEICSASDIEISFPKPFCAFAPAEGTLLAEFRSHFNIGQPKVELCIEDGVIKDTDVKVSAACGATYYVARWLEGRKLEDNIEIEVIAKRMSSYPCTASMERDPELDNDTPMHIAGQTHDAILHAYKEKVVREDDMIPSPTGGMIYRPAPAKENMENIETAKIQIVDKLNEAGALSLKDIRNIGASSHAAINSALLILKQDGRIKVNASIVTLT